MTNYSAKILNNANGALAAQQAVIATTSNNIANVNTPNYARRSLELETRDSRGTSGGINIGNGVQVGKLVRITDSFLDKSVRDASADQGFYGVQSDLLSRLEQYFDITGAHPTIGSTLTGFFSAIDDLTADPSSIPLRANFIQKTTELVDSIRSTYNAVADAQEEADQRLGTEINSINVMTAQIANLNGRIVANERSGFAAADERDARDKIMQELSGKISFSSFENADGAVSIALANGFNLVSGTISRNMEVTQAPSFASGPLPPSLKGGLLNYVVFDYDSSSTGQSHVDLTQTLQNGGGSVGGLLTIRGYNDPNNSSAFDANGSLVQIASRIEGLTRELLTNFNQTYLGADRNGATAIHDPSSGDLNGNNPSVYGIFDFTYSGAKDADGNGLPDDLTSVGIDSFSRVLGVTISDPRAVAAALDSGSGFPAAAVYAPGDGRNLAALSALQTASTSFSQGTYSFSGTFDQQYAETVGYVGIQSHSLDVQNKVAQDKLIAAQNSRDEISGVSLDEEFTTLIKFQKAFQAAARMIKTGSELLDQIIGLV